MKLRRLGASGVSVSPICFGTMLFGNPTTEQEATRLIHQAVDRGVTLIDTASSYEGYDRSVGTPGGVAEEYLGRILKGKRDQVVLLTKIANALGPGPHQQGGSRIHLQTTLESCLRRLQTDCVDILMLHWPDLETPFEESLRTLDLFVKQGKIRYFGVSNYLAWQMCELLWLSDRNSLERLIAYEPPYSMLRRDIEISEIGFCKKFGVGITPYQVLHGGWLSGKYRPGETPAGSRLAEAPGWMRPLSDPIWERIEVVKGLAAELGVTLAEYSIGWALRHPEISSVILGMRNQAQLESSIRGAEVEIPQEHLDKIDELFPLAMDLRWNFGAPKLRAWQ